MAEICKDIANGRGEALLIDGAAPTIGQEWFAIFAANARSLAKQYSDEAIEKYYPASRLLLQMEHFLGA